MNKDLAVHLNPENFQIDDRNLEDMILYATKLSQVLQYFDLKNKPDGNWLDFFITDETFLLVIILKYDLHYYDNQRLNLIKNFDEFSPREEKEEIFRAFVELIFTYFKAMEDWYRGARKNNLSQESSKVELELEQAILKKAKLPFKTFASYVKGLEVNDAYNFSFPFSLDEFSSIWGINEIEANNIFDNIDPTQSDLSSGLKKLILLYSPIYKVVFELRLKAKDLFEKSLTSSGFHKPHIGLLLSFLSLFEYLKRDLNKITAKHLDYFYAHILGQKPKGILAKTMYLTFNIDQNVKRLVLDEKSKIIAGQYEDGSNILFETNEEVELSNVSISQLITNFISRNNQYEFNSRYKLVAGIFQKRHCANTSEVDAFNLNQEVFAALGEEQMFKTEEYKSMDQNELGFAIASPLLVLGRSNRQITFSLSFSPSSIEYLSNLIIDIANSRGLSEEDVFNEIFAQIFLIEYTNVEGWVSVEDYLIEYPEDWSLGKIAVVIKLDKKEPSVDNFDFEIHELDIECSQPLFRFTLNPNNFYFGYSFLSGMELTKIDIGVGVSDLKEIRAYSSLGEIDLNSEFEMLGATPKKGAYILFSSHELFCKPIENFDLNWEFTNLPAETNTLEEYFANYNRDITDYSFQLKLTALSDYRFERKGAESFQFDMFQKNEDATIDNKRNLEKIEASKMKLKPNYTLRGDDLEEYNNDLETGYLKLELVEPNMGFGFEVYPIVYNEAVTKATTKKQKSKNSPLNIPQPNEPFSPTAENVSFNYASQTSLHFNQSSLSENDYEQNNAFFLFKSSNIEQTFSQKGVETNKIIPLYDFEGELLIGLENIAPPQFLNLLVEVKKSENANYQFSNQIEWLYTSYDGWKPFAPSDIIYDETMNLMKTGVVSLRVPQDITNNKRLYGSSDYFIKACSRNKADQLSLIKSIYTNGVSATEIIPDHLDATNHLPPNSAEGLEEPIPEIIDIIQPYSTFFGKGTESKMEFYSRMSELLKHKTRPVTKSDIEQFILSKFNYLSYAKCYYQDENQFENDSSNLKLLCLKKVTSDQNIEEVKLSLADMEQIQDYLNQYISPFVKIQVVNPIFEDIWIKCKVKFSNISSGKGVRRLNHDFFKFMTPWYDVHTGPVELKKSIKKSEIFNFIKKRPYISFVTGISIIHIKQNEDGGKVAYDSAADDNNIERIETGALESIFIPRIGIIDLLEREEYSSPEPINFSELNLEQNFIITSGRTSNEFGKKDDFDSDENDNNNIKPTTLRFKF